MNHSPPLVHKGVGLHSQHGCYEVLCVVTTTGYLDESINGATHKHHSTLRRGGEGRGGEGRVVNDIVVSYKVSQGASMAVRGD